MGPAGVRVVSSELTKEGISATKGAAASITQVFEDPRLIKALTRGAVTGGITAGLVTGIGEGSSGRTVDSREMGRAIIMGGIAGAVRGGARLGNVRGSAMLATGIGAGIGYLNSGTWTGAATGGAYGSMAGTAINALKGFDLSVGTIRKGAARIKEAVANGEVVEREAARTAKRASMSPEQRRFVAGLNSLDPHTYGFNVVDVAPAMSSTGSKFIERATNEAEANVFSRAGARTRAAVNRRTAGITGGDEKVDPALRTLANAFARKDAFTTSLDGGFGRLLGNRSGGSVSTSWLGDMYDRFLLNRYDRAVNRQARRLLGGRSNYKLLSRMSQLTNREGNLIASADEVKDLYADASFKGFGGHINRRWRAGLMKRDKVVQQMFNDFRKPRQMSLSFGGENIQTGVLPATGVGQMSLFDEGGRRLNYGNAPQVDISDKFVGLSDQRYMEALNLEVSNTQEYTDPLSLLGVAPPSMSSNAAAAVGSKPVASARVSRQRRGR